MNNSFLKTIFCIALCASLVLLTFTNGEKIGELTRETISIMGSFCEQNPQSKPYAEKASKYDAYEITGYAGGNYVGAFSGNVPTDIETLKTQAEKLFENYTKAGNIKEVQMGATSKTLVCGIVEVDNKTSEKINLKSILNEKPDYKELAENKPSILIYHTHTTEGYEMLDLGWYAKEYNSRTKDKAKNMVRVGDALTAVLEKAGYMVIHDRNIYDESYNGAYSRSRVTVEKYLKKYPSIQITLDVHRDAIEYSDGTRCKPTAEINGKKAAQVMIISGCEGEGVENFPQWKKNLVFATRLQGCAEENYSGLMRPIFFCHRKYNMDITPCSLLLEFGTDANTLEEAVYSAELIGDALVDMLDSL